MLQACGSADSTASSDGAEFPQRIIRDSLAGKLRECSVVLGAFGASRVIMLVAVLFSARIATPVSLSILRLNDVHSFSDSSAWWQYLLRWDSAWYLTIIRDGYRYTPNPTIKQSVAFFPLYPVLSWLLAHLLGIGAGAGALLVANAASVAAMLVMYSYVREHRNETIAFATIILISLFPASLYLSAGYAESLSLLFAATCFLHLHRGQAIRASIWSGLLTATRPTGIVVLVPLVYSLWPQRRWTVRAAIRLLLGLAIGSFGLIAYMVYLAIKFRSPLAFAGDQQAWVGTAHWSVKNLVLSLRILTGFFSRGALLPVKIDPWMLVAFIAITIGTRKHLDSCEALYCFTSLLFLIVTRLCRGDDFTSMTRYLLLVFPVFIMAAELLDRRPLVRAVILVSSALLLFWYSAQFALWHWVD